MIFIIVMIVIIVIIKPGAKPVFPSGGDESEKSVPTAVTGQIKSLREGKEGWRVQGVQNVGKRSQNTKVKENRKTGQGQQDRSTSDYSAV